MSASHIVDNALSPLHGHTFAERLADLLTQEMHWLDSLHTLLLTEQDALSALTPDTLAQLATEKTRILPEIAACEASRAKMLEHSADMRADSPEWPAHLAGLPSVLQAGIAQQWAAILDRTRAVRLLNQQNGQAIELSMRHVRGALDVLCGQSQPLYDPSGHNARPAPRRTFGSA